MTPAPRAVCQFQVGHTEPDSQGKNIQGYQASEEGRGRPRRAGSTLAVFRVGPSELQEGERQCPELAEPFAAPQRLCGSKLVFFYFYFIFKMKQGKEIEKRGRRNGEKGEGEGRGTFS